VTSDQEAAVRKLAELTGPIVVWTAQGDEFYTAYLGPNGWTVEAYSTPRSLHDVLAGRVPAGMRRPA
jgi:hypothetical protein